MFKSYGKLIYYGTDKLTCSFDEEICRYYRSLIPKYIQVQGMRYPPHITVIRTGKEVITNKNYWNKYKNEIVEFYYEPWHYNDENRFWLNIYSTRLEEIRQELGLSIDSPFFIPPKPFKKTFHTTIGRYNVL